MTLSRVIGSTCFARSKTVRTGLVTRMPSGRRCTCPVGMIEQRCTTVEPPIGRPGAVVVMCTPTLVQLRCSQSCAAPPQHTTTRSSAAQNAAHRDLTSTGHAADRYTPSCSTISSPLPTNDLTVAGDRPSDVSVARLATPWCVRNPSRPIGCSQIRSHLWHCGVNQPPRSAKERRHAARRSGSGLGEGLVGHHEPIGQGDATRQAHVVQQRTVVGDQQHGAAERSQRSLELLDGR